MVQGAQQAAQLIDQNRIGELWDGAALATRQRVARDGFVADISAARSRVGAARQRAWVAINRQSVGEGNDNIAGQYVSVEFESRFSANPGRSQRELLSFHLERDGNWRFSGYVLR